MITWSAEPSHARLHGGWRQRAAAVVESQVGARCNWGQRDTPGPPTFTHPLPLSPLTRRSTIAQAALARGAAIADVAVQPAQASTSSTVCKTS